MRSLSVQIREGAVGPLGGRRGAYFPLATGGSRGVSTTPLPCAGVSKHTYERPAIAAAISGSELADGQFHTSTIHKPCRHSFHFVHYPF